MPLANLTHATVEQVDAAIVAEDLSYERSVKETHLRHIKYRAKCRRGHLAVLKKLNAYRDALAAEQTGGAE